MKILSLLFCIFFLSACGDSETLTPEQQVKATLKAIEQASEQRSLSAVMEHISERYKDHNGNDKRDLQRLVQFQIIRNQKINIFTLIRSIHVDGDIASVELSAAMSAQEVDLSDAANRLRADLHRFSVALANENGQWLIRSVSWERGW